MERSRELGFLGPGPVEAHIGHALGFAAAFEQSPGRVLDLGSGGGVPGLVLSEHWVEAEFVLLDSNERRTVFLTEAVAGLGWQDRVQVIRARAEVAGRDLTLRGQFDGVVSRSFGSPPVTAECAGPFLADDGRCVVSEPPDDRWRWSPEGLAALGLVEERRYRTDATYIVLRRMAPCPDRYPRREGIPAKRPLW